MRKVTIDCGRVRIDSDMLSRWLETPVRRFVSTETNANADEQIRSCDKVLQRGKCREMSDTARIGFRNDATPGLGRDHRSIEQLHQRRHLCAGIREHGAAS